MGTFTIEHSFPLPFIHCLLKGHRYYEIFDIRNFVCSVIMLNAMLNKHHCSFVAVFIFKTETAVHIRCHARTHCLFFMPWWRALGTSAWYLLRTMVTTGSIITLIGGSANLTFCQHLFHSGWYERRASHSVHSYKNLVMQQMRQFSSGAGGSPRSLYVISVPPV